MFRTLAAVAFLCLPTAAFAQGSFGGFVRLPSGGSLADTDLNVMELTDEQRTTLVDSMAKRVSERTDNPTHGKQVEQYSNAIARIDAGVVRPGLRSEFWVSPIRREPIQFRSTVAKDKWLAKYSTGLAELEQTAQRAPTDVGELATDLKLPAEIGAPGRIPGGKARVLQVVTRDMALIQWPEGRIAVIVTGPTIAMADNTEAKMAGVYFMAGNLRDADGVTRLVVSRVKFEVDELERINDGRVLVWKRR